MRQVQIWGATGTATAHVEVPDDAMLQQILAKVAKTCRVQQGSVRVSVDGQRIQHLNQVPPPGQLRAAVRSNEEQQAVTRLTEEVSIPPKPVVMHQDMEGFSVVVAFDEVIDNSIRANATCIKAELVVSDGGLVLGLVCSDDGDGMGHDLAVNHMRLAHTDSGTVFARREFNKPLAAGLYFSKELSRHGKGAAALLYFGNQVETQTKMRDAAETVTVSLNYTEWMQEFADKGTCTYKVKVENWFDFAGDDDQDHYTQIRIQDLRGGMAAKLADEAQRQYWAQQVSDHYFFFLKGFPQELWDTLPADLLQDSARFEGGVTIDLFGMRLGQQALPQQMPKPRLSTLLDSFLQLLNEHGQQDGQPKLMPFWLPIRWCKPGMAPEQVPDRITVDRDDRSGPAGKLRGVHRDFLLLLLYYPYSNGARTKPVLVGDAGVEDVLFTAWSGRMIPKAFSPGLPPLVEKARQSREAAATGWMLTPSRLVGVLFCSPEVYTSNHKTELMDDAYDAVIRRLGAAPSRQDSSKDLWVYDTDTHKWAMAASASKMLAQHHKAFWAPLEEEGDILEIETRGLEVIGKAFKPPGGGEVIKAGDLVRLMSEADVEAGKAAVASSSKNRRGGAGSVPVWGDIAFPMNFRVVEYFKQNPQSDGPRVLVQLREWSPDWAQPGVGESHPAALISPLPDAQADKLRRKWNDTAPKYLAWWSPGKSQKDGKAHRDISALVSGAATLSPAQVPSSLVVCFVSAKESLVNFTREKNWSSRVYLGAGSDVAIHWELFKGTVQPGGRIEYSTVRGRSDCKYTSQNKATIDTLRSLVEEPGPYILRVKTKLSWVIGQPLEYAFQVAGNQAHSLVANWSSSSARSGGGVPRMRLTEELPALEIRAKDNTGKEDVELPFSSPQEAQAALKVTIRSSDNRVMGLGSQPEILLTDDRLLIKVKGWRLKAQELRPEGNTPMQAYVGVQLTMPDGQGTLQLAEEHAPLLHVLSGPASRLEGRSESFQHPRISPYTASAVSRGSAIMDVKLVILDEKGNKLDLGDREDYCARMRFEPPDAAILTRVKEGSSNAQVLAAASASKRKKSVAGSAAAAIQAAGIAAAGMVYPIGVDGTVVEVLDEFRWCVPPGAGPAGIIIEVFKGKHKPSSRSEQPILTHTGWYVMQHMHAAVEHSSIESMRAAARWALWRRKERPSWAQGAPFVLNTSDFPATITDRRVPMDQNAAVPDEVLDRFAEGFEPRRDVIAGQLAVSYIWPSGKKSYTPASADRALVKGKVPYFLAQAWNKLVEPQAGLTYEVAFLVTASGAAEPQQLQPLQGVKLHLCNEQDEYDTDFRGRAKLCLLMPDGSHLSVFNDDTTLEIAGGLLQLPAIHIEPDWFTADSKGTATLVLLDNEPGLGFDPAAAGTSSSSSVQQLEWEYPPQEQLGRFYLRLAPAAERLLLMAAGPQFEGVRVELPPQQVAGRGKGQRSETSFILKEQVRSSAAAGSSRQAAAATANQGAWAPWLCAAVRADTASGQLRTAAESTQRHVDPRHIRSHGTLRLQLGQPVTLHFVAVDFLGCPVVLTKAQRRQLRENGLQLQPDSGAAPVTISPDQTQWVWARDTAGPNPASPAGLESNGHLGGPFVNSCTFTLTCGCDRANLVLTHTGSFGRQTLLEVPVLLEAGPVAVDGLQLQHAQAQPHGAHATALYSCEMLGYADPGSLQQLTVPPGAATAAPVLVKQEPGMEGPTQSQQRQQQASGGRRQQMQQQEQLIGGDKGDPIDLTLTDDEGEDDAGTADMEVEQPEQQQQPQPQMSPTQQWLAGLGPSQAALLYQLQPQVAGDVAQLVEGSTVKLQLQLYDSAAHEIAAEKEGKLMLMRLQNRQELQHRQQPGQQVQADWQAVAGHLEANLERGTAEVVLQLGVGDDWVGEQVFQVQPRAAEGSELAKALPVLLKVNVAPGPFADSLQQVQTARDPAAAAAGAPVSSSICQVTAAEALDTLYGVALQLLQQLPALLDKQQEQPEQLTGEQCTILQVSSSSSQGPAALLPELAVQLSSRDGSAFAPQSLQPLRLQLQVWQGPDAAAAADGALGAWVAVQTQQQPRFGAAAAGNAGIESVEAVLRDLQPEAGAHQQQQQRRAVFEVPMSCRQLPAQAGLYRIVAGYDSDLVTRKETLRLPVGPFLLLPGPPHRLLPTADPQQDPQPSRGRAVSGNKRGRGRGSAAAAAGRGATPAQPPPPEDRLVMLDKLATEVNIRQVVQLQDCWGNGWEPAAAKLAARLPLAAAAAAAEDYAGWNREQVAILRRLQAGLQQPPSKRQRTAHGAAAAPEAPAGGAAAAAAAGGQGGPATGEHWALQLLIYKEDAAGAAAGSSRQAAAAAGEGAAQPALWQHVSMIDFDADGTCTLPETALSQLGISGVGDWQLYGWAVPASLAGNSALQLAGDTAERLQVLLGSWQVVSESKAELAQKERAIKTKLASIAQRLKQADATAGKHEAALSGLMQTLQRNQADAEQGRKDVAARRNGLAQQPVLLQLKQQAVQAAGLKQLLGQGQGNWRRDHMLERPWQQAQLAVRTCTDQEVQQLMPVNIVQLHHTHQVVLGPMVTLGAVECRDVAAVLSAVLGQSDLRQLVCLSQSVRQQVDAALNGRDWYGLDMPELISRYYAGPPQHVPQDQAWYSQHSQRLLLPPPHILQLLNGVLDWHRYDPQEGFVGFGVNLLHLNPQLLTLPVVLQAQQDRGRLRFSNKARMQLDLRRTLWFWKLGSVLVFETQRHLLEFKQRLNSRDKTLESLRLVALDGFTMGVKVGSQNHKYNLTDTGPRFGPAGLEAADNPLDLRLRCIKERQQRLQEAEQRYQSQQAEVKDMEAHIARQQQQLAAAQQEKQAAAASQQQEEQQLNAEWSQLREEMARRERQKRG